MAYKSFRQGSNPKGKNETQFIYQKKHEQMSKQEELIEQKKMEIQKRLEEKKRKETEEALQKLNESKPKHSSSYNSKRSNHGRRYGYEVKDEGPKPGLSSNIFNNDGSFLEQFQKISGVKVEIRKRKQEEKIDYSSNQDNQKPVEEGKKDIKDEESKYNHEKEFEERQHVSQHVARRQIFEEFQPNQPNNNFQSHSHFNHQSMQSVALELLQPGNIMNQQSQQMTPHHSLQQQHHMPQNIPQQHQMQQQMPQLPQQQMFTCQSIPGQPGPMPPSGHMPPMNMNFAPNFNPMQCGMILPPPMTPSNIPPPAPLNPGSIPSPSPLQPCSIPSPSPLQPYAIPPPSPLIPHSIPPPSPMIPHSIPPPSPLTPHSIPPPLPLRPQSIPPPMQGPPMFLGMAPPPPPPPDESSHSKVRTSDNNEEHLDYVNNKQNNKENLNVEENVKGLFNNDDYSSSEDDESDNFSRSRNKRSRRFLSDSESDDGRKSPKSDSARESDGVYDPRELDAVHYPKEYSMSGLDSDAGQESRTIPDSDLELEGRQASLYNNIVLEDTQTQFPSDTKESSSCGNEDAPTDQASDDVLPPGLQAGAQSRSGSNHNSIMWQNTIKPDPDDVWYETDGKNISTNNPVGEELIKQEVKTEEVDSTRPEITYKGFVKQGFENNEAGTDIKIEEGSGRKRRRSRWADSDEKVPMPPEMAHVTLNVPPPPPPHLPPSAAPLKRPGIGLPGMALPTGLGGINKIIPPPMMHSLPASVPTINVPGMSGAMISKVTRSDPALVAYAMKSFGRTNLTEAEWKKAEDHYKINLLYQDMMRKREELKLLEAAGKNKYEYDSDEETEGGTWEHKVRTAEMEATQKWADELTEAAKGKHHIGDFLPPEELSRFMEKYEALKDGREPDLSDYKEFKLKEDNVGFQMLQKLGWTEGQGLGPDGAGVVDPVNKAVVRPENQGLGIDRPDDVGADDDEYDAYRKRMMLAYRFRPNPMNNPRRPYY